MSGLRVFSDFFRFGKPLLKSGSFWFLHHAVKFRSALFCSTWIRTNRRSRGGSVGIATRYGLDGMGIESRWWRIFLHLSRPALGPTQPRIEWVPGLTRGKEGRSVALATHSHLAAEVKERVLPLWVFVACSRVNFTFT